MAHPIESKKPTEEPKDLLEKNITNTEELTFCPALPTIKMFQKGKLKNRHGKTCTNHKHQTEMDLTRDRT
jgi:hypothetical protein